MINILKKILNFLGINRNHKIKNEILLGIGSSHFLNIRERYGKIKNLNELDFKVFSQSGEDGIIDYLLYSLNIKVPKFVEIGVGDYQEANTRFLFERTNAKGLIIDCIKQLNQKVSKNITLWKGDLTVIEKIITESNINNILEKNRFNSNLDLFSLDIDGIDYWIIKSLPSNISKVFIAEYNSTFGADLEITVPNISNFSRTNYHHSNLCFGMSLKALIKLMKSKNFVFVGTSLSRINAFFISKEEIEKINLELPDENNLEEYVDSNIRESRDVNGKLSFLSGSKKIEEIKECEVVDLTDKNHKLTKIKNLLNKNLN